MAGPLTAVVLAAALAAGAGCDTSSVLPTPVTERSPWQLVNPRPFAIEIAAMWGDTPDHVMAVGRGGAVLVKEGHQWREAPRPINADFYDLHGCDWHHIYALSGEGVHHFDGREWLLTGPGGIGPWDRIWCRAPDDVLVVSREGWSEHFDGRAWTRQDLTLEPLTVSSHWLTGTADGYLMVGRSGRSARWRHGHWEDPVRIGDTPFHAYAVCRYVEPGGPERLVAAATFELYTLTGDQGWEQSGSWSNSIQDLVAGGGAEPAYILSRDGNRELVVVNLAFDTIGTATGLESGVLLAFPGALPGQGDRLVLGGRFGTVMTGSGAGGGLVRAIGGEPAPVTRLLAWPDGGFTGFHEFEPSLLQGRPDGTLTLIPPRQIELLWTWWGPSQDRLYGVGYGGKVVFLGPDQVPQPLSPAGDGTLRAVWGTPDGELWVGGDDGLWRGDGQTWEPIDFAFEDRITLILGTGSDDVYILEPYRVLHWNGQDLAVLHGGSYIHDDATILAPDGRGILCAVEPQSGSQFLFPTLRRLHRGGGESHVSFPGSPSSLAALADGSLLTTTNKGLYRLVAGTWTRQAHPTTDRGGYIRDLVANQAGDIHTVSDSDVIHHLDSGGSGLWR